MNPNINSRVANTLTQAGIDPSQYAGSSQPAPNFIEKLLPTVGGILGGIGGTLAGGPLGGIAGAGIGGGLGKGLENASLGQNPVQGNDLTAALENAGGQALGGAVGSVVGKVAGMAAQPAESLSGKLMQGAFKGGESVMSMHPNEVATQLVSQGVTDPNAIPEIASHLTGSDGVFSSGVSSALKTATTDGASGIDITGIKSAAQQALEGEPLVQSGTESKIMNIVNKAHDIMLGGKVPSTTGFTTTAPSGLVAQGAGDVQTLGPKLADPLTVFDQVKTFEKQANKFLGSGNPESQAVGRVYQNIADQLKEPLFSPGGTPLPVGDEIKQQMLQQLDSSPLSKSAPGVYSQAQNDIQAAQTIPDLRSLQRLWVNANNGVTAAQSSKLMAAGTTPADIARGTLTAATSPKAAAASLAINSPGATSTATSGLSKIAQVLQRIGDVTQSGTGAEFRPSTMAGGALGAAAANLPNYISPSNPSAINDTMQGQPMNDQTQVGSNVSPVNSGVDYILHQLQAQPADAQTANLLAALGSLAPQAQKNLIAAQAAGSAPAGFANAGGAQGLGGILTNLTGAIPGTPANAYQHQQILAQATLGQALGVPAGATAGVLPGLAQSNQTAQVPQSTLQALIQSLGGGSSPALGLR